MQSKKPTVESLPVRRGVVARADGISDTYGTPYVRDSGTGQLHRTGPKMRRRMADEQRGLNRDAIEAALNRGNPVSME
jgi:hypothetical protein